MRWIWISATALLLVFALVPVTPSAEPWSAPSFPALLGSDEFGRDQLRVLLAASGRSTVFGIAMAGATTALAIVLGYVLVSSQSRLLRGIQTAITQIVESVPVMIWVLIAFSAIGVSSPMATGAVFVIAMLPFAIAITAGEFTRVRGLPYMEAARLLGVPWHRQLTRHILPNCSDVLGPLFIQITGLAIAIQGAIGLLGFANRTDLDLGILLLRGKENIGAHPGLLLSTLACLGLLYLYLAGLKQRLRWTATISPGFA